MRHTAEDARHASVTTARACVRVSLRRLLRFWFAPAIAIGMLGCAGSAHEPAHAAADAAASTEPADRALDARVLWAGDGRVYLAARDSISLDPGTRLTFFERGKPVAEASAERVLDGRLIAARVTSGTEAAFREPGTLEVRASAPRFKAPNLLRVGIPDERRASLLVNCSSPAPPLPPASLGYRSEPLGNRGARLVRGRSDSLVGAGSWPDTLLVLRFGEATDEEIALERGEIDVGVFWPGELSSALRQGPLGQDLLLGTRAHGGLAVSDDPPQAQPRAPSAAAVSASAMQALNRELFRSDLLASDAADSGAGMPVRFRAEGSLPGHAEIERVLNAHAPVASQGTVARRVRVFDADSLARPAAAGGERVLRVRCPVVCAPELRAYIRALSPDAFAELPGCAGPEASP
jgi:hypothetical protein